MSTPKTLQDVLKEAFYRMEKEEMKEIYREHSRKLEQERAALSANNRQEGGSHYKKMGVEPWDVVDTWPLEQQIGYYRGGALKYIMRMGSKDESLQEIAKGKHYLEKLIEILNQK